MLAYLATICSNPSLSKNASHPLSGSVLPANLPRLGWLGGLAVMACCNACTVLPLYVFTVNQYWLRAVPILYGFCGLPKTVIIWVLPFTAVFAFLVFCILFTFYVV